MKRGALALALLLAVRATAEEKARPRSIAFLVLDGVYNTELVAPMDVLQHVVGRVEDPPDVFTVGSSRDPVRTAEGLRILPDYSLDDAPLIDLLVVASTVESRGSDRRDRELIRWLSERGQRAKHVVSLCWGAFLLAEAGLLDGGPATTFPADLDRFEMEYPEIDVKRGVSFVDAGHALTSVGGVKSYELAMYLVEELYGSDVASGIASGLLIDWDRSRLRFHREEH